MAVNARSITASIRFLFDASALPQAQAELKKLYRATEGIQGALNKVHEVSNNLGNTGAQLNDFASRILDPMKEYATNFTQFVGATTAEGQKWLRTSIQIEQSQLRIGRASARALQPMHDNIARITKLTADFIDQHPELVRFVATTGGIAAGAATVLAAGSQLAGILASGGQQLLNAARFLATSRVGVGLGAAAVGGALGFATGKGISQGLTNVGLMDKNYNAEVQKQTFADIIKSIVILGAVAAITFDDITGYFTRMMKDFLTWVAYGVSVMEALKGKDFGKQLQKNMEAVDKLDPGKRFKEGVINFANQINDVIDGIDAAFSGRESTTQPGLILQDQMLFGFESFLQQQQQQLEQYEMQVDQQTKEFYRQQLQERSNFDRQIAQQIADFEIEQGRSTEEYYRQESLKQQDFYLQQERAAADHRRNLQDAAARLDALGVLQEMRQFNTDKKRAEEDFKRESQRSKEEFKRQEDLARQNFNRQLERQKAEFRIQQQQALVAFNAQLKQQADQYQMQARQQADSFRLQLQQQNAGLFAMEQRNQQYYETLQAQLTAFINNQAIPGGTDTPPTTNYGGGSAGGGYGTENRGRANGGPLAAFQGANVNERFRSAMGTASLPGPGFFIPFHSGNVQKGGGSPSIVMPLNFNGVGDKSAAQLKAEIIPAVKTALLTVLSEYNGA